MPVVLWIVGIGAAALLMDRAAKAADAAGDASIKIAAASAIGVGAYYLVVRRS